MKYLVMEIQTFEGGAISTPTFAYDDQQSALAKYYAILSAAATSKLPYHAAVLMNNLGTVQMSDCFEHAPEPEGEEEG